MDTKLEERRIPFRRNASSYIGACALGNRDRCTTWFDSFCFVSEQEVSVNRFNVRAVPGRWRARRWAELDLAPVWSNR